MHGSVTIGCSGKWRARQQREPSAARLQTKTQAYHREAVIEEWSVYHERSSYRQGVRNFLIGVAPIIATGSRRYPTIPPAKMCSRWRTLASFLLVYILLVLFRLLHLFSVFDLLQQSEEFASEEQLPAVEMETLLSAETAGSTKLLDKVRIRTQL